MNDNERDKQKEAARKLLSTASTTKQRAQAVLNLIEVYHYGNFQAPSFEVYASHWLWASQNDTDIPVDALTFLSRQYPFPNSPKIQMGYTDWGSYGNPSYPL